jgi:hypothetical protein
MEGLQLYPELHGETRTAKNNRLVGQVHSNNYITDCFLWIFKDVYGFKHEEQEKGRRVANKSLRSL